MSTTDVPAEITVERRLQRVAAGDVAAMIRARRVAERLLQAASAAHLGSVGHTDIEHCIDALPRSFDLDEWRVLKAGVEQRVRLHEAILGDIYGPDSLLTGGVLPVEAVRGGTEFEPAAYGWQHPVQRLTRYSCELVQGIDGRWRVTAEHTDAPVGAGQALLTRSVLSRVFPDSYGPSVAPLGRFFDAYRAALGRLAPGRSAEARVVMLAPPNNAPGYVEFAYLATQLGYNLVTPGDLTVRDSRLWLRAIGGLEPITVVVRGVASQSSDALETSPYGLGIAGLLSAARTGTVGVSNSLGSGASASLVLRPHLDAACQRLLGSPLLLAAIADGAPGEVLSPVTNRAGEIVDGRATLHLHAVFDGRTVTVMPGGSAHVVVPGEAMVVQDVVVPASVADRRRSLVITSPIDLRESLPSRAGEALFWMGRNAERCEFTARAVQVTQAAADQDPWLVEFDGGEWAHRAAAFVTALSGGASFDADPALSATFDRALSGQAGGLDDSLRHLLGGAIGVREFLSNTTWAVFAALERERNALSSVSAARPETLERILVSLAALSGLAQESMVRGPGWQFLDLGRRWERARSAPARLDVGVRGTRGHRGRRAARRGGAGDQRKSGQLSPPVSHRRRRHVDVLAVVVRTDESAFAELPTAGDSRGFVYLAGTPGYRTVCRDRRRDDPPFVAERAQRRRRPGDDAARRSSPDDAAR